MREFKKIISSILLILLMLSCSSDDSGFSGDTIDFGEADYYKSFWGVKSDTVILERKLKFVFNDYAKEKNSSVKIKLVDPNNNRINDINILLYLDGKIINNKIIDLRSDDLQSGIVTIGIRLLPNFKIGYTSGFLSVSNHSLDRINDNDLATSSQDKLFKWEAEHSIVMNPLKKGLLWFIAIVGGLLLLWFLVMRSMMYPKFKKGKIQILEPYFSGVNFGGNTKLIIFTDKRINQSLFNTIFTGKIEYEINSLYDKEIKLRPGRGNKIKIKLPLGAKITPPIVSLDKFQSYTLEINKRKIKIQYS